MQNNFSSFFKEYFLGESIKHILFRLTFILSIIILFWFGMICTCMIRNRSQKKKQMLNLLSNDLIHQSRFHSSSTSTYQTLQYKYSNGKTGNENPPRESHLSVAVQAMTRRSDLPRDHLNNSHQESNLHREKLEPTFQLSSK